MPAWPASTSAFSESTAGASFSVIFDSTPAFFQYFLATLVQTSLTSNAQIWPPGGSAIAIAREL
ncbi:hypothetical protein D3C83_288910 [compost metagenome]